MVAQRAPNPQRRSARSQAAILKAAYELCQEQGYARLTIEGIAARAGVGKQTIYRWWPSKGAVLLDVFVEQITGRLDAAGTGSPLGDLRRRVRVTAEVLADNAIGPHIAGLLGDAQGDPALAHELHERLVAPARAQHRELIRAAQVRGELRADMDADLMADALFAPLWFRLLVTRAELSPKFADDIVDTVTPGWTDIQARGPHR
jgi:AcrR family transcriptional regulator